MWLTDPMQLVQWGVLVSLLGARGDDEQGGRGC